MERVVADERCPLTELLPAQCGCKDHRNVMPSLGVDLASVTWSGPRINAHFDSVCAVNETHAVAEGDPIYHTSEGWACQRCKDEAVAR